MPDFDPANPDDISTDVDEATPSDLTQDADAASATRTRAIGAESVRGAAWVILFSMAGKLVKILLFFLALAILNPEDMGVWGLATTVTVFAVACSGSLQSWLIHRNKTFYQDAGQVFWLGAALNIGMAIVLAIVAPLAGLIYGDMEVTYVILVSTIGIATGSFSAIYFARLQHTLRFGLAAAIHSSRLAIESIGILWLAYLGWGPFAIVVPQAVIGLYSYVIVRLVAGRMELGRPHPQLWKPILASTVWLMIGSMATQARSILPYSAAGLIHGTLVVGYLNTGTMVAIQTTFLLSEALRGLFFAALRKLNDEPLRQFGAMVKGMQTLLVVITPVCLLQALLAGPVIDLFLVKQWLPEVGKWKPSIPVIQCFSIAMLAQPIFVLSGAVLLARGRFRLLAGLVSASTLFVLIAAFVGALIGKETAIAIFVSISLFLANVIIGIYTFRFLGHTWAEFVATVWRPFAVAIPTSLIAYFTSTQAAAFGIRWEIASVFLATLISYSVLIYIWLPEIVIDIVKRLKGNPEHRTDETDLPIG